MRNLPGRLFAPTTLVLTLVTLQGCSLSCLNQDTQECLRRSRNVLAVPEDTEMDPSIADRCLQLQQHLACAFGKNSVCCDVKVEGDPTGVTFAEKLQQEIDKMKDECPHVKHVCGVPIVT